MGNLTDDMTRLRGEVDALRGVRGVLMQELTRGAKNLTTAVAAMRADFASAHAAMAKQTRGERGAFVSAVIVEVNSLLGEFSRDRNENAQKGRADRGTFLAEMRKEVMGLCKGTTDDLKGARLVWRGRSPEKSRPVRLKKEPVSAKPVAPPVEAAPKKTAATPEFKAKKPRVTFMEPPKKEPVVVKPILPSEVTAPKKTVAAPEIKIEKPPVTFKEPPKMEAEQKIGAASEFKPEKPPVTFKEPLKKEEKITMAAPEAAAVETPNVKTPPFVGASTPPFRESKEKSRGDEKPANAMTRGKRGRK